MKSATGGHTRHFQFSLLIAVSLLALPVLNADAMPGSRPSTAKQQELREKIDDQQKILRHLHAQIDQQAKVAESARETTVGAGALGDTASVFIDEYVREQKKLDELKRDLAPRITQAEQALAVLQGQQTALSAQAGPRRQPVQATKPRAASWRKKPVTASGAPLHSEQ